jgi:hypothetical protein
VKNGPRPAVVHYRTAKERLLAAGFAAEINWQLEREFSAFTETDLLRETAWVILCSGFRESVVRDCFDLISLCFCDWESSAEICHSAAQCRATAHAAFGNSKKIDAILGTATIVHRAGFLHLKQGILDDPISSLQMFPFIGPVTSFHLAKNLGYAIAKPDRHLVRLASALGYSDVQHLCSSVSQATGDPIQVVDVVLWRYAERYGAFPTFPKWISSFS